MGVSQVWMAAIVASPLSSSVRKTTGSKLCSGQSSSQKVLTSEIKIKSVKIAFHCSK